MFCWGEHSCRAWTLKTKDGSNVARTEDGMDFFELRFHMKSLSVGENVAAYIRSDDNVFVIRKAGQQKNVKGKERIRAVSCEDDAVILLSEEGKLLSVEAAYTPRPLEVLCDIPVSQVACGSHHSVALTKDGQVYTWGQDSSGQLGLGKRKPVVGSPQLVRSLWANPLVQVSAGGEQSFALAVSGSVFSWGKNHRGQLGLGDTTDRHTPTAVQCLNMKKTVHISCGREHTATLTKGGTVFTFGSGQFGQLGHNSFRDELRPRVVSELWGAKVTEISCGRHHTLVLTDSRRVYSFGCGEQGQLGRREESRQSVPLHVQLPHAPDVTDGHQIGNIYAGGNCSFALCAVNKEVHQESNPRGAQYIPQQCLDDVIEKWISKCNAKTWKKTQREIKRMFSSASCVNKSFLDQSGDKHFQTSPKYSGLNLSLARRAFKKLVTKDTVWAEVEAVLMQQLLPSLGGKQVGVEGLRLYLLLSELLHVIQKHKPQQSTQLAKAVAAAIQRLPAESLQVLADWCLSLERSTMIKYVKVWKQALSETLSSDVTDHHSAAVKVLLQVLQCLYNVVGDGLPILCCFPFVMNLQSKKTVFDISSRLTQAQHQRAPAFFWLFGIEPPTSFSFFELRLKRASLLEGTLQQLADADHTAFKKPLVVYFDGDPKLTNVYMKDFFHKLFEEIASAKSGMFMYNDSKTLAWFPSKLQTTAGDKTYFLFGVLCGLALYNQSIIYLPFPMALFKKLVGVKPSLDDMVEFSPVVGRNLLYILEDYVDDDIENLYMDFSIVWDEKPVELDPQDPGKPVTSRNKREFVEAYVNYAFSASVEEVFEEFSRGFFEVCERDVVRLFRPEELKGVMVGKESYDWAKLKQNTVYQDFYHKEHPTILMFWDVFAELTEEQKKALLLFVTGFDRVPILGMNQVRMIIRVRYDSTEQHFPEALTCYSILELPFYSTREVLKARLTEALSHNRGFFDDEE
ncbi:probable E3 ubiquitin-protein ligase HERC3 isoform X2 [Myripristis murdjan]|uniref:probable E3 ubiquitin-protein ligase HERC3 isoform X2 n=1 Tax=Myripristis murdjan TaxID=586833 RepID=UPI0011761B8B|nr:probable E3 ubiquitin-protein ligase HERC3 isoform X2 [Myripristis murdjan]